MNSIRHRLEAGFEAFGRGVVRHRWWVLLACLAAVGAMATQLRHVRFDTSTESFFRESDPAIADYNAFRDLFGRDEVILIAVRPPEVFDRGFLLRLQAFHEALADEVPYLDEVTSLVNARLTRGEGDELIVEDLLETVPDTPGEMARLRERVMGTPLYRNFLISPDAEITTVVVRTLAFSPGAAGAEEDLLAGFEQPGAPAPPARQPLTDAENARVVGAVERVVERFEGPAFPLYVAGSPVVTDLLKREMQRNMARFLALAVLTIGGFLGVLFRRVAGVVLPLLIVLLSLAATISLMAALGVALKLPTMILPSFLLAVGVGASVHLLAIFFRQYDRTGDRPGAVVHALGHSGLPIVMTGVTTAAGLASFSTARMATIADLGWSAASGVLIALVLTLAMLPALLALVPLRRRRQRRPGAAPRRAPVLDRLLMGLGDFATGRPRAVTLVSLAVLAAAMVGLGWLRFSHNTLTWFPRDSALRQATELVDTRMEGSVSIETILDTGAENGLYRPEVLHNLDALARRMEAYRNDRGQRLVGKTFSVADLVKEIHQALNEGRPAFYAIPDRRRLIAQELLLFENSGSDDMQELVDSSLRRARFTARVPWDDAATYVDFVDDVRRHAREIMGPQVEVTVTGLLVLFTQSVHAMMQSTVVSYAIAAGVITLLMILLLGSVRMGLISMVPNLAPIAFTLGMMGWLGIRLDMFTLLIGSIAIGLAVDDTIHFFHNFRRYYGQRGEARFATHETLLGTGRAMLFTTLVLVTGFWLFMFASLNNLFHFGLLTGITLAIALLADILLAPALMTWITQSRAGRDMARRWGRG